MPIHLPENTSILVSRTDSIGDVILTIPLTFQLKKLFPQNKVVFLCTSYTQPILKHIQTIDTTINYNDLTSLPLNHQKQIFQQHSIYASIIAFPSYEITRLMYQTNVPYRVATSHRWYSWIFCNQRVSFSRKNSNLHEAQLNFKLLEPFGYTNTPSLSEISDMYQFKTLTPLPETIKQKLHPDKFKVILHPKSKGSAREWKIENYIQLIKHLDSSKYQVIITGTKNELPALQPIFKECSDVLNLVGETSLDELISLINECDALIAASTGTLHMAAILGKHTIGIYPPIRPMHPGRWAAIGKNVKIFCKEKDCHECKNNPYDCRCVQSISSNEIASYIYSIASQYKN
ncbi:MAG: glycosyltransferase family 9 protein [Bacteroidia bacterium]|nr:glycosyltransferase family 9 protein [Bacteroidia bacterium]